METLKDVLNGKSTILYKNVKDHKYSGAVYLPKKYIGKNVIVIVKGDEDEKESIIGNS